MLMAPVPLMNPTMTPGGKQRRDSRDEPRRGQAERLDIHGILLLDKSTGISSNQALQQVKRLYRARKAGHTGSLDPLASGMLPVCLGQATRVSGWLLDADKTYEVTMALGERTDTADADGEVIETASSESATRDNLEAALQAHRGDIQQIPPMYSALKHQGQRLYRLARAGHEVDRPPRWVCIRELELLHYDKQYPQLLVRCSKGTYVRSLVESIAAAMGTLAHVCALRRLGVGPFNDPAAMHGFAELQTLATAGPADLQRLLLPVDSALQGYAAVQLSAASAIALRHGQAVPLSSGERPPSTGHVRLYEPSGVFLGLGELHEDGRLVPRRLFGGTVAAS